MKSHETLHLILRGDGTVAVKAVLQSRSLKVFNGKDLDGGDGLGTAHAMMLALCWALPRAGVIYCWRKNGNLAYRILIYSYPEGNTNREADDGKAQKSQRDQPALHELH